MRLLIFFIFCSTSLFSQIGTGQWRLHIPSDKAIDIVAKSDRVFTAYTNGLTEYGYSSKELSVWDAVNGLSDISVTCLGNSISNNAVFVGYENGNLDKIKNNRVTNIPAIKLAEVQGSKRINSIVEFDDHMYVATGFAIVKIDPIKNEVRDTYYPTNGNQAIIDIAFRNDTIFALTDDKMYTGYADNIALADPTQWTQDSRVPEISSNEYAEIETVEDRVFVLLKGDAYGDDTVFTLTQNALVHQLAETFNPEINGIKELNGKLVVNYFPVTAIYDELLLVEQVLSSYSFGANVNANAVDYANSKYWLADNDHGLVSYSNGSSNKIMFQGPPKDDFYSMDWEDGKLIVNGGALKALSATINRAGLYVFEDETWSLKDQNNMNLWSNGNIWDFITASINPTNTNQFATGTYSFTPLSIGTIDGQITDTLTPNNSLLEVGSIGNGMTLISDINYDENGNLWILNGYANAPLKVYTKDGLWYEFDLGTTAKSKFSDNMEIDYNGNKWLSIRGAGLYGYKDNGTIADASDDEYVLLNIGENTGALPSNQVNAIAVDFDNEIWIGTDNGFAVLYNSDGAFGASFGNYNAQRIKLEFEGNVEYVLGDTDINDIAVDGANRKWFATSNSGIILLSPDGLEIIEQHTMENSPLISDNILDIEIDHSTGEMFIITDLGLMSYRTDASYEDSEYNNVTVFPNPARPEHSGPITIQGIRFNSDVKITDIAGNLVYKTTSNGGTATWDGKTLLGERVATGVYLIWTAANEGKGRKVGKVLVVN
ncbi:MAG: hypothetical protein MK105_04240 [Crocinitomicaceae bacterium]|nr:hypothetical protein [Crocinitomicaceae bacterium]